MNNKKKILIVEDSEGFRKSLKWILEPENFEIIEAEDGAHAKDIIKNSLPDLIISDLQMPNLDGVQLHTWVKKNKLAIPFIAMTGHGDVSNTQDAHARGMQGFITKPFSGEDIIESVKLIFENQNPKTNITENRYFSVPISHFLSEQGFTYSVYIYTSENKYIKISHKGEVLDSERIKNYQDKGVKNLFILKRDFSKYLGFNLGIAKGIKDSRAVSFHKKQEFMSALGESVLKCAFLDEIDSNSFEIAKEYVETAVSMIIEADDLYEILISLRQHSDYLYGHSLAVSTYSVLISKQLGWITPSTLFKVALGGLFHDIGKKELDPALLQKPQTSLSHPELKQIESHVIRGVEILSGVRCVSEDVIQMVHHHHESVDGTGYPQGLKGNQIFRMAKVVTVANQFCNFAVRGFHPGYPPLDAISKMLLLEDQYDPDVFLALCRLFNVNYNQLKKKAS